MLSRFLFFVLPAIFHIIYVHINALKGNKEERNGKWLLEDDFLTLNSKTGDSKMFACKGETLEEVGGDCLVFYSKDELKKPSTAAKKVSVSKYAGYWKASEVTSQDELRFTKMFISTSKKGKMNIYMQQNFGATKRVAKAVKLKLSKKKDCVSFKTRINQWKDSERYRLFRQRHYLCHH